MCIPLFIARNRCLAAISFVIIAFLWGQSAFADMFYVANGGDPTTLGDGSVKVVTLTGAVSTYATGFNTPRGLAFDSANNLYVACAGDGTIQKVAPNGSVSIFASGLSGDLYGLAIDQATGMIYVSDINLNNTDNSSILRFTPGGVMTTFATVSSPGGLVFDTSHNLYVTHAISGPTGEAIGGLNKVSPTAVVTPVVSSGISDPIGLARSASGDFYAAERTGDMRIMRVTAGGSLSVFATGVGSPYGEVFGPDGKLYVVDFTGGQINAVNSAGAVTPFATGFSSPRFMTLGPDAVPEPAMLSLVALGGSVLLIRRRPGLTSTPQA